MAALAMIMMMLQLHLVSSQEPSFSVVQAKQPTMIE
jgi:hypothetical protein